MFLENKINFKSAGSVDFPDDLLEAFLALSVDGRANGVSKIEGVLAAINSIASIVCTDLEGNIVYANELFCKLNNCRPEDIIGKNNRIFKSGYHSKAFYDEIWGALREKKIWRGEICDRSLNGTLYWMDSTIAPRYDARGEVCGYMALRLDITARKEAEAQAIEEHRKRQEMETLLNDIVETLPNGVIAYDRDGRITYFNQASKDIYDHVAPGIEVGRRRQDIVTAANRPSLATLGSDPGVAADPNYSVDMILHRLPNGHWIQVQNRRSQSGTLVSVQTDVTDLKRIEEQMAIQAERDPLTGVFNRHALLKRLSSAAGAAAEPCTYILIDLDAFKAINDSMGHDCGDTLLCRVAQRLESAVRRTDVVARLGGDEFAILLPGPRTESDIRRVIGKLRKALSRPVRIGGQTVKPSASMGVATFPADGATPAELMKSADLALYRCKRDGRGDYRIYDASMRRERLRREILTDQMRLAMERDEFAVVLQPQQDMTNGRHIGFEALVRWNVGDKPIPPLELISIAEEAGLVTQLSYQIVEKTLAMMARFKQSGLEPGTVGINVVAAQLHEPNFVGNLMRLLRKYDISPAEIEIEVTENVILDRSAKNIARVLHKLHSKGMSIALDDFGMGYASLTHLKRFPLNRLKIDRSFVHGLLDDIDDHIIVRTIISLAHNLGLQVVAEGIENAAQYKELVRLGCDSAQGFLIGRPMDEIRSAEYCRRNRQALQSAGQLPRMVA